MAMLGWGGGMDMDMADFGVMIPGHVVRRFSDFLFCFSSLFLVFFWVGEWDIRAWHNLWHGNYELVRFIDPV